MTGARALLPCLLLALGAPSQEPEPTPSIGAEIAALIERTNALESFHCVWIGDEGRQRLEFAYTAPETGRVSWVDSGVEVDGIEISSIEVDSRFDEHTLTFRDEEGVWRSCQLPHSPARVLLDELFPVARRLGPGFEFSVGGAVGLACEPMFQPHGRDTRLAWLARMEHEIEAVVRAEDVLVWTIGNCELRVARDSGFPQQITLRAPTRTLALELVECSTDEAVAPVAPPEDVEPALEDDIQRILIGMWDLPSIVRNDAFDRVGAQLGAAQREWNSSTRADWDAFLVVLHGSDVETFLSTWLESLLASLDDSLRWARATLEEDDSPEVRAALATYFEELEQSLAPGFEQTAAGYLAHLAELEDARAELLEAERETILRLHDERITQPVLAYLAEERAAILGE